MIRTVILESSGAAVRQGEMKRANGVQTETETERGGGRKQNRAGRRASEEGGMERECAERKHLC